MSDAHLSNNTDDLTAGARRLRFPPAMETLFRDDYYRNSLFACRTALAIALFIWSVFGIIDFYALPDTYRVAWFVRYALAFPVVLTVIALSFSPNFKNFMQPALVAAPLAAGLALVVMAAIARPPALGYWLYPPGLLFVVFLSYSFFRMRFYYATATNLFITVAWILSALCYQKILRIPDGLIVFVNNGFFLLGANAAGMAMCYSLEASARRAFLANYLLDQERADEARKRRQTEAMLHVLGQAIGGIVHDLGNPLTAVQTGAETLELFLEEGEVDKESLKEFTSIITDGAQMLNFLRLSLMEQTRVLEGKTIPVELKPTPIRRVIEAGARYQKPRYANGRTVFLDGEDVEIRVDEMKLTTVFMNLIGNALKYSDGEVRITWRRAEKHLFIAVLDQGRQERGLSPEQAAQLFVAFGRLDTHAEVEGTGLGLLSVRKIAEAHGGEIFIEGRVEGVRGELFSTARSTSVSLLVEPFHTAFVVVCPLEQTNN